MFRKFTVQIWYDTVYGTIFNDFIFHGCVVNISKELKLEIDPLTIDTILGGPILSYLCQ